MEQSTVKSLRLPASSIVGIVYSRKKSYNCADVSKDPNYWESGHGRQYKSFVASPIADDAGGVKGVLCVDAQSEGYFDDDDVFFIELFADVLSVGMSCT
jgi:signal transduction protein with GAF and PtsI domain